MTPPRPAAEHAVESLRVLEARTVFASWAVRKAPGRRRDLDAVGRLLPRLAARAAGSAASGAPAGILPTVVVTGSKGKGEVAARTAGWLTAAGVRTGLVTSPGIVSNRDRFALDGRVVGERDYRRWLGILAEELPGLDVAEDAYLAPTGLFSALGHALLADLGAEVVVHEAGMGGAHDEVSLFDPLAVALTTVLPEHLDAFGPTLADVAREKFGLVHSAAPVASVAQADEIQPLLERACTTHGAPLRLVPPMPFPEANREVAAAAARAALARLGRGGSAAEDPEPFVLNRPGRGCWNSSAHG